MAGCVRLPYSSAHHLFPSLPRAYLQPSSNSVYTMESLRRGYNKTKDKFKDNLRPPSSESVLASPSDSTFTNDNNISTAPGETVSAGLLPIETMSNETGSPDAHWFKVPAHYPTSRPERSPDAAGGYAQPPSSHSKPETLGSFCNDLLTIVHSASDVFPPLKSAIGGVLEVWKQCEVRRELSYPAVFTPDHEFSVPPGPKKSSQNSRASSKLL